VDKIWHAHKIIVQNFRKVAYDSCHYLLTAKVRSGLSVSKWIYNTSIWRETTWCEG